MPRSSPSPVVFRRVGNGSDEEEVRPASSWADIHVAAHDVAEENIGPVELLGSVPPENKVGKDNTFLRAVDGLEGARALEVPQNDDATPPAAPPPPASSSVVKGSRARCWWLFCKLPKVTIVLIALVTGYFFSKLPLAETVYGVGLSSYTPQSPPYRDFPFVVATAYPECADVRYQATRLITYQLTHNGLLHIVGNVFALLGWGIMIEELLNPFFCLVIFEMGCFVGAIFHGFIYPYIYVVGCSCGIYAFIGALTAIVVLHGSDLKRYQLPLCLAMVAQLLFDLLSYFVFYSPSLAWFGHLGGYISGLSLTFTLGLFCPHRYQRMLGALGATAFALFVAFLVYHMYATPFPPPIPAFNPLVVHSFDHGDCCIAAFSLMNQNRTVTMDEVRRTHYCAIDTLVARDKRA